MSYFNSSKVNVFPSGYRMVKGSGKFTSEQNLAGIILSVVDKDSYVIDLSDDNVLTVVIKGYLFEIEDYAIKANDWVGLAIQDGGGNALVNYSNGSTQMDDSTGTGLFYGLCNEQGSSMPTPPSVSGVSYHFLQVTDSSKNVIHKFKFNASSVQISDESSGPLSVEDELNYKSYLLTTSEGHTGLSGYDGVHDITNNRTTKNVIRINTEEMKKLDGLENKGSKVKAVYFDDKGIAQDDMNKVGELYDTTQSNYIKSTSIIIDSTSCFSPGFTMYASTIEPNDNIGKNGDFWLKYTN